MRGFGVPRVVTARRQSSSTEALRREWSMHQREVALRREGLVRQRVEATAAVPAGGKPHAGSEAARAVHQHLHMLQFFE